MLTATGGIASFQAIMHVLSELRNPLFDTPDRQRALRALQMSRLLRENNSAKAWQAVRSMIDRAIAEHNASPRGPSLANPPVRSKPETLEDPSNDNVRVVPAMGAIPSYAIQVSSGQYTPDPITTNAQQVQPNPNLALPMRQPVQQQPLQQPVQPNWDDFNLSNINNIVGDMQPTPGILPDFDFVSIILESEGPVLTDHDRAFGATHSIMRTSLWPFPSTGVIISPGPDESRLFGPEYLTACLSLRDIIHHSSASNTSTFLSAAKVCKTYPHTFKRMAPPSSSDDALRMK
jgi:hypothetical protein